MTDQVEKTHRGTAYGSAPAYHHVVVGEFVCTAPKDAKCRTSPSCECENWCCCSPLDEDHDEGEHCCMTTVESGRPCWIEVWVAAQGVADSLGDDVDYDDDGEPMLPDGPVACDWDDGIQLTYAEGSTTPEPVEIHHCDGCGEDYNLFEESHVGHGVTPPAGGEG